MTGTPTPNNKMSVPNILIAVMGATGTGKSAFIKTLTGDENIHVGHGQESKTDEVQVSPYFDPDNNCNVILVDTPGFDDSRDGVTDTDILRKIVDFLQKNGGQTLTGLIYMHRISDPRMGGISKRNLRMFRQLCGDGTLKNVSITTTNWDRVSEEEGNKRELELSKSPNLFKPLIDEGAQLTRHNGDISSARSIINHLIHKDPAKLQIQIELDADPGTTLEDTSAGAELRKEIVTLKAKYEAELLALEEEMKTVREKHAELLEELKEERRMRDAQTKKMEEDLENLKMQVQGDKVEYKADDGMESQNSNAREEEMKAVMEKHAELLAELEEERQMKDAQTKKMAEDLENLKMQVQTDKEADERMEVQSSNALEEEMKAVREKHAELLAELEEERRMKDAQTKKMEEDLENLKMQVQSDKEKHEADERMKAQNSTRPEKTHVVQLSLSEFFTMLFKGL